MTLSEQSNSERERAVEDLAWDAEAVACQQCGTPGPWNVEPHPGLCGDCAHRWGRRS